MQKTFSYPLAPVTSFKYLGLFLSEADDDCTEVVSNFWIARHKWAQLTRVLTREGMDAQTSGLIYLSVVQLVMLYRSETWVMTPCIERVLDGFHHRVTCRMTGRQPQRGRDGLWVYTPMEASVEDAGLQEVETYFY